MSLRLMLCGTMFLVLGPLARAQSDDPRKALPVNQTRPGSKPADANPQDYRPAGESKPHVVGKDGLTLRGKVDQDDPKVKVIVGDKFDQLARQAVPGATDGR